MKMRHNNETGSVLLSALITAGLITLALVSYLGLALAEQRSSMRAQSWNAAMPIVEAGIEEALAHLNANKYPGYENLACGGWTRSGTNFLRERTFANGRYVVTISDAKNPVVASRGFAPIPLSTNFLSRTVLVTTTNSINGGLQLRDSVNLNGNGVVIDSFDSTSPLYSSNGIYVPGRRKAGAHVSCNSGIRDAVNIGNANIYGSVATGPGGSVYTGPMGAVGNLAWHASGMRGIQAGSVKDDATVVIPNPPPPPAGGLPPMGGRVGNVNYAYVLGNGVYQINGNLSAKTIVLGNATLIVTGDITLGSSAELIIATNASLRLYANSSCKIGGAGLINQTGLAKNLFLYGMPTCTSIDFNGGIEFTGQILAPQADVVGGGGGGTIMNFIGSVQAKSLTLSGRLQFHYDESLGTPSKGHVITSWNEL